MAQFPDVSPMAQASLLRLPSETLSEILTYLSHSDLLRLMLVSQSLHDLAAANLYRYVVYRFSGIIPSHVRDYQLPANEFTDLLETLATSDFNYAANIKTIDLAVGRGDEASWTRTQEGLAYQFKNNTTNGRLLNALILATVKRITALDLLRWDIKVQLSPSVFAALGKFSTLQFIHIRMDSNTLNNTNASNPSPTTQWAPNSSAPPLPPPPPGILPHHHAPPPLGPNVVILPKGGNKSSTSAAPTITPPTFSHFRRLKYLAILDIESLDILDQIAECISASSTSLVTLQISFSAKLTSRARKGPAMETTSDSGSDTESEDDVYLSNNSVPPPPPPPATQTTPATALNTNHDALVRNERLAQERALHRIFDLGKKTPLQERVQKLVKRNVTSAEQMDRVAPKDHSDNSLDMKFMDELHAILADLALGAGKADTVRAAEKLQLATGRFLGYLNSSQGMEALANENSTADSELGSFEAAAHLENDQEPVQPPGDDSDDLLSNNPETHPVELNSDGGSESRAFASPVQPVLNDFEERLLEVVDMEHPDTASEGEDQEFVQFDENENQRSKSAGTTPREQGVAPGSAIEAIPGETQLKSSANTDEGSRTDSGSPIWEMSNEEAIQEYIRLNHGVALEALTIQRIPLKTSAICQALNMWSLRHICLLDVGSQRTFWAMLTQLNSSNPLRIRSIHSDDVSPVLLKFVSSLRRVEEVFFHEKSFDAQETSSVPAPVVRIDDISNLVLEKHARHLKRLMIRSDVSTLWNFNKKAIARLAKCRKLTELVIAVDSWHFHAFMHIIGNLTSLVALHILFSAPEYCAALLRELRLCAIDIIYQNRLPGFRYVGISHMANGPVATKITELQWPIYKSLNQREKSMEALAKMLFEAKSRVQQEAQAGSSYGQSFDSDPEDAGELPVKYTRTLEVHEVKDIKIWKREIYNSHL